MTTTAPAAHDNSQSQWMKRAGITQGVQRAPEGKTIGLTFNGLASGSKRKRKSHNKTANKNAKTANKNAKTANKNANTGATTTAPTAAIPAVVSNNLFTFPQACPPESRQACIDYLETIPVDEWITLGPPNNPRRQLKNRQLLLGPRANATNPLRPVYTETLPPCFQRMYREVYTMARLQNPEWTTEDLLPSIPKACTVNRYPVSNTDKGQGSQLGYHQDKGAWRPLVIGVTLGPVDWRTLAFRHPSTKTVHKERTEPGDGYLFRNEMYTEWQHASLKRGSGQKETVYTVTFRFEE